MSAISVSPPYPTFNDAIGESIEDGAIYIGTVNQNPLILGNQLAAYSDAALTVPVAQPIRTNGGYPINGSGSPIRIYVDAADYSIAVLDHNGALVFSSLANKTKLGLIDLSTDVTGLLSYTFIKYDISPAEIAAGLSIVNNFWPWGYLDRYATNTTPGTTPMDTAWAAADAQSAQGGAPIYCRRTTYGFSAGITVDYRSEVDCDEGAIITYLGSNEITFLTIGTVGQVAQYRSYNLPMVRRSLQSNWTNEANIGIKFINISNPPLIRYPQVANFTIGVQTLPQGGNGFQFCKAIEQGHLLNNKIGLDLSNATAGYTNENVFRGGRFSVNTGVNSALARYGVRITSSDGAYTQNNNNVFDKPSFELNAGDAIGEAVPILMVNGTQNHFVEYRDEGNDTPTVRESNSSTENTYSIGYSNYANPVIDSLTTYPNRVMLPSRTRIFLSPSRKLFDSGAMHKLACYYDGATNIHIPYVSQCDAGSAGVFTKLDLTLNANYLDTTHGMSIFVETIDCKQFFVTRSCESGRGGRVVINCYDAAGALITTAGSVLGTISDVISATVQFGGAFRTGSDGNNDVFFTVTDAVKAVRVSITNGDATLRIRSFAVHTVNYPGHCATWTGYEQVIPGANIGTAAPTAGTWIAGRLVLQAVPTVGQPKAWACTVGGTPGTWVSQGNL